MIWIIQITHICEIGSLGEICLRIPQHYVQLPQPDVQFAESAPGRNRPERSCGADQNSKAINQSRIMIIETAALRLGARG